MATTKGSDEVQIPVRTMILQHTAGTPLVSEIVGVDGTDFMHYENMVSPVEYLLTLLAYE